MGNAKTGAVVLAWMLGACLCAGKAQAFDVPTLNGRVNDNAGLLSEAEAAGLNEKLKGIEVTHGHQFVFLSVATLQGQTVDQFAVAVAHAWKLGDAKRDDGLLFVIAKTERKIRIEVGYGLEGAIPDAVASRIIREIAGPAFKRGDWAGGTVAAFDALATAADPKPTTVAAASESVVSSPKHTDDAAFNWWPLGLLATLLGCVGLTMHRSRKCERERLAIEAEEAELARLRSEERQRRSVSKPASRGTCVQPVSILTEPVIIAPVQTPARRIADDEEEDRRRRRAAEESSSSNSSSFSFDSGSSSSSDSGGGFSGGGGDFGGGGASGDF